MKIMTIFKTTGCLALFYIFSNLSFVIYSQDAITNIDTNQLTIVFTGDIMGHDGQIKGAYDDASGKYNYEPTFRYISDYISDADISVGNFEVTLAGPPYKGYPQFSSPDELAIEAKKVGFDIMAMANNHALDGGEKGFLRTLMMMDSLDFFHMGTYRDSLEKGSSYPLIIDRNNFRIAFLNYTYGTNGLTIRPPNIINRIDTAQINSDIFKANLISPDFIIVFIHWGIEYERQENSSQRKLAAFMFEKGVDIIIGSHPHVVQPYSEMRIDKDTSKVYPVVYSLGNLVSNQRDRYRDGGIIAEIHLSKQSGTGVIDSIQYLPYWVWRTDNPNSRSTFHILPISYYEIYPDTLDLNTDDISRMKQFATDTRQHMTEMKESSYYLKKQKLQ
jgi:poly-gamma-glutamate capsule biosynthesis protein CapA/YwtB (metallophosphatase superfamily)